MKPVFLDSTLNKSTTKIGFIPKEVMAEDIYHLQVRLSTLHPNWFYLRKVIICLRSVQLKLTCGNQEIIHYI